MLFDVSHGSRCVITFPPCALKESKYRLVGWLSLVRVAYLYLRGAHTRAAPLTHVPCTVWQRRATNDDSSRLWAVAYLLYVCVQSCVSLQVDGADCLNITISVALLLTQSPHPRPIPVLLPHPEPPLLPSRSSVLVRRIGECLIPFSSLDQDLIWRSSIIW